MLGTLVLGVLVGGFTQRAAPEIPYPFFLLHGLLLLSTFSSPMSAGMNALSSNTGLLVYPAVKPIDPFIARLLLALVMTLVSMTLFSVIGMWMGVDLYLGKLDVLLACYLLAWLCGSGLGLIFGVAAAHFKEVEKIVPVIKRPLLFVSAVLYPLSIIPESGRKYLLFNPLIHMIETGRQALFPNYPLVPEVNLYYPTCFTLVVLSFGLGLFYNNRNFLLTR